MAFRANQTSDQIGSVIEQELYGFISEHCAKDLLWILKDSRELVHFPIVIGLVALNEKCPKSSRALLGCPDKVLSAGERAAYRSQLHVYEACDNREGLKIKLNVHIRIKDIPNLGLNRYMTAFPGCDEAGTFMALVGTVVKTSATGSVEFKKDYKCSKCQRITTAESQRSRYYRHPARIDECEHGCVGTKVEACKPGVHGIGTADAHRFKDYQEIKIQEQITNADLATQPKTICIVLENDLVDSCKPGDDVVVTGTLYLRYKPFRPNQRIESELVFMANHVQVENDGLKMGASKKTEFVAFFKDFWKHYENDPFAGRNYILRSFCPQVYELYIVKLAVCVIAGGVSKGEAGSRVRGQSHLLLVGDPGLGKSQLLKYTSKLVPQSIFTTGTGSTAAGLTVAAVKEEGTWHLEAGSVVLARGGICCIDEFCKMKEIDRVSIHEVMEQQSISVAKAGMVSKLETDCTIIAATNPKISKVKTENEEMDVDSGLPSPLLSRFDLVIVLKDIPSESWDERMCDFILKGGTVDDQNAAAGKEILWDTDVLRAYMVLIKEMKPQMTKEAADVISDYYFCQRKSEKHQAARSTIRLLESMHRLAEGHARLMFRNRVLVHDAVVAITLIETSMQSAALTQGIPNPLHIGFPGNDFDEYYNQANSVLRMLNLASLWQNEKKYLEQLRRNQTRTNQPPPKPPVYNTTLSSSFKTSCSVTLEPENVLMNTTAAQSQAGSFFFDTDTNNAPCSMRMATSRTNKPN